MSVHPHAGPSPSTILRAVGVAGGVAGLWWALPHLLGVAWSSIAAVLGSLTGRELAGLTVLWFSGLVAYTFVLTGALPGLNHRRALTLNLTGSAVANVTPFGGAAAMTVNLAMLRSWRYPGEAFAASALVTAMLDLLVKLGLPLVALVVLVSTGGLVGHAIIAVAASAAVVFVVVAGLAVLVLASDRGAQMCFRVLSSLLTRVLPPRWRSRVEGLERSLAHVRTRVRLVVTRSWRRMALGITAYLALQLSLLWCCLRVTGSTPSIAVVLTAFAVERALSLALVTPGGTGLAEAGAVGVLVALGVDPVAAGAGVLLYRGFVVLLEIPVGGVWLGGWLLSRRWHPAVAR